MWPRSVTVVMGFVRGHPQRVDSDVGELLVWPSGDRPGGVGFERSAGEAVRGTVPAPAIRPSPGQPSGPATIKLNGQAVTADRLVAGGLGWATTHAGLFVTGDAGGSWRAWPLPVSDVTVLDVALLSPSRALVASSRPGGVVISATGDSGRTWQASDLGTASGGAAGAEFAYSTQRVAGLLLTRSTSSNFSLADWYTTNGDASWTRHDAPSGGGVSLAGDGTLWLAGGPVRDRLYNSGDGGASWNRVALPQEFAPGRSRLTRPRCAPMA